MPLNVQPGEAPQAFSIQQTSPYHLQQTPSHGESKFAHQTSPPYYSHHPNMYAQQNYQGSQGYPFPQQQQSMNSNGSIDHGRAYSNTTGGPHLFSGWTGYNGPVVDHSLDDENTVPPKTYPWELKQT